MQKQLHSIERYLLNLTILLLPLIVLPIFPNAFTTPKLAFTTVAIATILLIKALRFANSSEIKFSNSKLDLPILLLLVSYLTSTILRTPNRMEALLLPGTTTTIISAGLLYFLVNQLDRKGKKEIKIMLLVSGAIISIISIFALSGILQSIPSLPEFVKLKEFNTLGGSLPGLIFLVSLLPISATFIVNEKKNTQKALHGILISLIAFGLLLSIFNALPGRPNSPRLTSLNTSWVITIESLKTSPLMGVGPGNYLTAFNRFKPIEYNSTDLWSTKFSSARSFYFTLITETGLIGAASLFLLLYTGTRIIKNSLTTIDLQNPTAKELAYASDALSLAIVLILLAIFPANANIIALLFIFLAINAKTQSIELVSTPPNGSKLPIYLLSLPILIGILGYSYYAQKLLIAEFRYKQALSAITNNDGNLSYTLLQRAITKNPNVDRYRISYAQVNLALANTLAQSENIEDQTRNNISQLVQQAIREGKAAVALNPQRASNWEILGSIYRSISPLAEGADQFAVQTYNQAIALDPLNTNLRIALGGLFYANGNFEQAIEVFRLATLTKQDHANAHFNLAAAYRENGQIDKAIEEMTVVLSLVDDNSDDFQVASEALKELQERRNYADLPEESSTNLTPPQEAQEPIEPQIELPEDAQPPEPTPTPTP